MGPLLRQAGRADLVQANGDALAWLLAGVSAPAVGAAATLAVVVAAAGTVDHRCRKAPVALAGLEPATERF